MTPLPGPSGNRPATRSFAQSAVCLAMVVALSLTGPMALAVGEAPAGVATVAGPADPDARVVEPALLPTTRLVFRQQSGGRSEQVLLDISASQVALLDAEAVPTLLLDRTRGTLVLLDAGERTVWRLEPPELERIATAIRDAMQRARAELLQLDEDTRAQAELALTELLGAPAPAPLQLSPQRERGRIAGLPCQWHALQREGRPAGRVCAAHPAAVPGGEGWLALLQSMAAAHAEMTRLTAEALPTPLPPHPWQAMAESGQLPLRWQQASGVGREAEAVLIVLERVQTLEQPLHAVPHGYRDGFDPP